MTLIPVYLAVNNEHGNQTRRVETVRIGDPQFVRKLMTFSASLPFSINPVKGQMTIARRRFAFQGHTSHVGNVLYDAVWMRPADVADLVNHLRDSQAVCEDADAALLDKFDRMQRFDAGDFVA